MPDLPEKASDEKRATRVALRTLRRRPDVVGQTKAGETIFELRSVRMVLSPDGSQMLRLVPCCKCGQDILGNPLRGLADLERLSITPMICKTCVAKTPPPPPNDVQWLAASANDHALVVEELVVPGPATAMQEQIGAIKTALMELAQRQTAESEERRADDHTTRAVLQRAVQQRLDALDERISASQAAAAGPIDEPEDEDPDRTVGVPVVPTPLLDNMRADVQAVAESQRDLAQALSELDQRLVEMAERLAARPTVDHITNMVERRVEDREAVMAQSLDAQGTELRAALVTVLQSQQELDRRFLELSSTIAAEPAVDIERVVQDVAEMDARSTEALEANRAEMRAAVEDSVVQARSGMTVMWQEVAGELGSLREAVEVQRRELEARPTDVPNDQLSAVAEVVGEMAASGPEFERRLDRFERRMAEQEARLKALVASSDLGATRVQELDVKVRASVRRLTRLVGAQAGTVQTPPPVEEPISRTVLDNLDRQLRAAELRLTRHRQNRTDGY